MTKSWYKARKEWSSSEESYCAMIENGFMMRSQLGEPIPYKMTEYQREFHAASLNIKREEAKDILFIKARGISFTYCSLIELIITAATWQIDLIPIISQRFSNACKILNVAKWLIKNCKIKEIREGVKIQERSILFTNTGCIMEPYPSANAADAIRGMRLIRGLLDEFAFQLQDEDLWAAAQDCIQGDFGQWLIGSTPCGMDNLYFKLVQDARKGVGNFYLFDLPVFDPKANFNPQKSILEQPGLVPIAPWISMNKLEDKRRRDWRIFMQENMTDFLDDSISFIPYRKVMAVVVGDDDDGRPVRQNHRDTLFARRMSGASTYETDNPITIGIDFAETADLFSLTAYEHITTKDGEEKAVQIYLDYFNGIDTPELVEYCVSVIDFYPSTVKARVDKTGPGVGLFKYLRNHYNGVLIEGIDFRASVQIENKTSKEKIRKIMCVNLKEMIEFQKVSLLNDDMQNSHLTAINYALKVTRDKEKGHGDIFFANALALLPSRYSYMPSKTYVKAPPKEVPVKDFTKMPVEDKIKWYAKQGLRT